MIVESLSNGVVTIVASGDTHVIEINDNEVNVIGADQIQSDWNQTDNLEVDFIKNKPTIPVIDPNTVIDADYDDDKLRLANTSGTNTGDQDLSGLLPTSHLTDFDHDNIPIEVPFDGDIDVNKTVIFNGILYKTIEPISVNQAPDNFPQGFEAYILDSDSRLSDARIPTAHKSTHATGGSDALSAGDIGAEPSGAVSAHNTDLAAHSSGLNFVKTGQIRPLADSTNAIGITKADGTGQFVYVDSTNGRIGIGADPSSFKLFVNGPIYATATVFSGNATFYNEAFISNYNGLLKIGNSSTGVNSATYFSSKN